MPDLVARPPSGRHGGDHELRYSRYGESFLSIAEEIVERRGK